MLFPYQADVHLNKIPFFTILVCILCVWTFYQQMQSERKYENSIAHFCRSDLDSYSRQIVEQITSATDINSCAKLFLDLRESKNPDQDVDRIAAKVKPMHLFQDEAAERNYIKGKLFESFAIFQRSIPNSLTDNLQYNPKDYQPWRMLTSVFAHGDFWHIFYNLLFFYMFAATLEVIVGGLVFVAAFLATAVITHISYSWYVSDNLQSLPSIGLSGVVMGMMTFVVVLAPNLRIKCLFWIFIYWRVFRINAVLFAGWYVFWNIYDLTHHTNDHINYMAHVSGAAFGAICGFIYRFKEPKHLREVVGF